MSARKLSSRSRLLLLLCFVSALAGIACSKGSAPLTVTAVPSTATLARPVDSSQPASTPTPAKVSGEGLYPVGSRTGNPPVDRFIDLVERRDAAAIGGASGWSNLPCTNDTLNRSVPRCTDGSSAGTLIPALRSAQCETTWITDPAALTRRLDDLVADSNYLYGVYRRAGDATKAARTTVQFAPSLTHLAPPYFELDDDGHLVGIGRLCNWVTVLDSFSDADWILRPATR